MAILQPSEYDASYFDGNSQTLRHNAGYGKYERWNRHEGENSTGEYWKDKALEFASSHNINNKKVLELGCAKGFLVQDLRDAGVDAYGMDCSAYAIGEADPAVAPYLTVGNILTDLGQYSNKEFDLLFSMRTMECQDDAEINDLISEMKRISKKQVHIIGENENPTYYNNKTLEEWLAYGWPNGTILINLNGSKTLIK